MVPLAAAPLPRPYTVEAYDVRIRVDIANQSLDGEATIRLRNTGESAISALEFDAGGMRIASVTEDRSPQYFERKANLLAVVLTDALQPDERRTLTVKYQARAASGLKFFPDQVYTTNTSDWMPCNCQPDERSTLHLTVAAPPDMAVAASGQLKSLHASEGQTVTEWALDSPVAPQWFGFAIGRFDEKTSDADGVKLRVLGAGPQIFEPTAAALRYFGERTGKRYPGATYTQVFVHGGVAHSMAGGLTLLPESYAQGLEKQPDALRGLAEALAHQWYGIGIAAGSKDAWLSQGIPAYLADTFVGERFGTANYDAQIARARDSYSRLRGEGKDQALSDTEWTGPDESSDSLAAIKGAYFLYQVREMVGENAFWNGLRSYTDEQWGKTAESENLQNAFAGAHAGRGNAAGEKHGSPHKNNGKDLSKNAPKTLGNLFDVWVYGIPLGKSK